MVSIDTNVIRRLIENNANVINEINELKKCSVKLAISIDSFFEIIDQCDRGKVVFKDLIMVMNNYEIKIAPNSLYPLETIELKKIKIDDEKNYIYLAKNVMIPSFSHIISVFVSNYYKAFLVFMLIATNQKSESIVDYYRKYTHKDIFSKKIIKNIYEAYIEKRYKFVEVIENDLYNIAQNILLNKGIILNDIKSYKELFGKIKNNVKYEEYYNVIVECDNNIDEVEYEYMINYAYDLIFTGKKLDLNDIVDFFNIFSSYKSGVKYITCDNKGLKLWKRIIRNNKFLNYLENEVKII